MLLNYFKLLFVLLIWFTSYCMLAHLFYLTVMYLNLIVMFVNLL